MTKELGQKVKEARTAKGLSQRRLAALVPVDHTYICKMERDKCHYQPDEKLLSRIAALLDLDTDELILLDARIPQSFQGLLCRLIAKYGDRTKIELLQLLEKRQCD